jgi:LacI family transcriptional regulator, galactose operon repressor
MADERTTIRKLAELSGVSIGTVSRALNGYRDVRPETRERITRLALEHDYTPAAAARSLVTQRSHVIGVFLETGEGHPDLQHPFFLEVLGGLKARIGAQGYDLLLFASERPGGGYGVHSFLMRARHHAVEAVAVMGVDSDHPELDRLVGAAMPCVGVDVEVRGPSARTVMSDNAGGAALAVRHLHALGHRRIATVTGMLHTRPGVDRVEGFRAACAGLGIELPEGYVQAGDFYAPSGREACARLLALPEPPTAVFAASDLMALGVVRAAAEAGLRVPEDLSVVGFDDIALAAHVNPPLTTIRQDKGGLGAAVADAMVALIGGEAGGDVLSLPVELVERASSVPLVEGVRA